MSSKGTPRRQTQYDIKVQLANDTAAKAKAAAAAAAADPNDKTLSDAVIVANAEAKAAANDRDEFWNLTFHKCRECDYMYRMQLGYGYCRLHE
jgi:hypothetical protein